MTFRLADRRRGRLRSLRAPPCYGLAANDFLLPDVPDPLQVAGFGLTLAHNNSFKPNPLRGSAKLKVLCVGWRIGVVGFGDATTSVPALASALIAR